MTILFQIILYISLIVYLYFIIKKDYNKAIASIGVTIVAKLYLLDSLIARLSDVNLQSLEIMLKLFK